MPYIKRRLNFDKVENDESSSESESELFQLQNHLNSTLSSLKLLSTNDESQLSFLLLS